MRPILMPLIVGGLALAALTAPSVAGAAPILTGSVGATSGSIGSCGEAKTQTGSSVVSLALTCGDRFGVLTATAFAGAGHVGATARSATFGGTSTPALPAAVATYSDFLVFTSSDHTATEAEVSVNVLVDGILNAALGSPLVFTQAFASFRAFVVLAGTFQIQENLNGDGGSLFVENNFGLESGVLGPAPHALLRSPTVIVSLNTPTFFAMGLEVGNIISGPGASARSEFGHTFALPTGSDVFNLPGGVTVNAGSYLVNNRYFDPTLVSASVPEPAGWGLMLAGVGLAGAALRRRARLAATT